MFRRDSVNQLLFSDVLLPTLIPIVVPLVCTHRICTPCKWYSSIMKFHFSHSHSATVSNYKTDPLMDTADISYKLCMRYRFRGPNHYILTISTQKYLFCSLFWQRCTLHIKILTCKSIPTLSQSGGGRGGGGYPAAASASSSSEHHGGGAGSSRRSAGLSPKRIVQPWHKEFAQIAEIFANRRKKSHTCTSRYFNLIHLGSTTTSRQEAQLSR